MKKLLFLAASVVLLAGCASNPRPSAQGDSLVIGYFSLYFPDEYFNSGLTRIERDIELDIRDITSGRWIVRLVYGGPFQFVAHAGDTYVLESSRANLLNGSMRYVFGPRPIGLKIVPDPGKVVSLGTIQLTYNPVKESPTAFHQRIDYSIRMGGMGGPSPLNAGGGRAVVDQAFDVSISQTFDDAGLLSYIPQADLSSPWLSREVQDVKVPSPAATP